VNKGFCHSEERSDEESLRRSPLKRSLASLGMTGWEFGKTGWEFGTRAWAHLGGMA